jgi:hypothetical protein
MTARCKQEEVIMAGLVPAIHDFDRGWVPAKGVDARHKGGHDAVSVRGSRRQGGLSS